VNAGPVLPEENPPTLDEALQDLLANPGDGAPEAGVSDAGAFDAGGATPEAQAALHDEPTAEELGIELPADPVDATRLLLRELAEARQEAGEYLETLQRIAADFENFRKRVERDHAENVRRASQRVLEAILPALDSFDAALGYDAQTEAEKKLLDGMRSTHGQLLEILEREGFAPVPAVGAVFDPAVHEAVAGPSEAGDGDLVVASELRRGYVMQGRVIRPSLVTVEHA
jgi:molecular chaperone GrpE